MGDLFSQLLEIDMGGFAFKPWMAVKVTNENSGFTGQAGTVIRVEHSGEHAVVQVQMDSDSSIQSFAVSELEQLG
jgi:DNA-binding protein YbaB